MFVVGGMVVTLVVVSFGHGHAGCCCECVVIVDSYVWH